MDENLSLHQRHPLTNQPHNRPLSNGLSKALFLGRCRKFQEVLTFICNSGGDHEA